MGESTLGMERCFYQRLIKVENNTFTECYISIANLYFNEEKKYYIILHEGVCASD